MKRRLSLRFLGLVGLVATVLACSRAGDDESQDSTSTPIQGGTADSAHPSVGLIWFAGGGFCTGTLIAPTVILTAGHCVQDPIDGFYTGQGAATGTIGSTPGAAFQKHAVDKWVAHPSYSSSGGCPNSTFDIGLVHLTEPLAGVTPTPIASSGASPAVGTSCVAVGYGTHTETNGTDTFEEKRTGTETVKTIAATSIEVKIGTALADHGDSGGPLICNGVIAGATSCHTDGDWPDHQLEHYARVDAAAAFINQQIQQWGSTPTDAGVDTGTDAGTDAGSACSHDRCTVGGKLVTTCDTCVAKVCAADSFCCANSWDSICVGEVKSICNQTCGTTVPDGGTTDAGVDSGTTTCAHAVCAKGGKLAASCDTCAASICASDAFCCAQSWDATCVKEVKSICNQTCN